MITARSPYQIYKAENVDGSVSDFNSLLIEDMLPYKIASAEEALVASLAIVESDEAQKAKYAVSTLRAASAYVSHLISYVPLSARSQTAKKIDIHYDAVVRTVVLFGTDAGLFQNVKNMVLQNAPASQVSLKDLSDLEGALNTMEKEYRQKAKDAGEKVDMLRKVAPEQPVVVVLSSTPVKSQGSSDVSPVPPNSGTDEDHHAGNVSSLSTTNRDAPGKRRPRSQSAEAVAMDRGDNGEVKVLKTEGGAEAADGATTSDAATVSAARGTSAAASFKTSTKPRKARAAAGGLVWGRLRGLTNNEKKAVGVLQTIIQLLGHIYASKFNDLVPLFDLMEEKVQTVQTIIDTERAQYEAREDKKPPEPFHEVDLAALRLALETSSHTFRTDEECRYELDEDLLHPIAHACLTVINTIEGYATEPFKTPTAEELEKKQQLRVAARAKREEAKRRAVEKAEAKAELERKKEEEKQLMRRRLGDHEADDESLEEDTTLPNPSALGYVAYAAELPLGSTALYEKALYVWSMLVSVPRALNLSQMHFDTFLKGILYEDQDSNGLMEEVTKCLLGVSMEVVRVSSPNTPRITMRGKNWFDGLVEFVGVASGTKKKRQQQRRRETSTEEEEEEEEEDDDDSDSDSSEEGEDEETSENSSTSSSSSSSSSSQKVTNENDGKAAEEVGVEKSEEAKEANARAAVPTAAAGENVEKPAEEPASAAVPPAEEEVDSDPFTLELKATMDNIAQLRSLATWGNVDVVDRLNLLQFCVQEALFSDGVRNEADRLQKESEEELLNTDKRLKEIRDEAEKELKALLRTLPAVTSTATARRKRKTKQAAARRKIATASAAHPHEKGEEDANEGEGAEETVDPAAEEASDDDAEDAEDAQQAAEKDFEVEREAILQAMDRKRADVYTHLYSRTDGHDDGALVQPLGMDRYHRLYWRFPLERVIFVQTVPSVTAAGFPVLPEPEELRRCHAASRAVMLLDDEEVEPLSTHAKGRGNQKLQKTAAEEEAEATAALAARQKDWGFIPFEYLTTFVQTLDRRGKREAPLRRALETLAPYLARLEEVKEGRVTRSRANTFGYLNRLKVDFSY